MTSPSTIDDMRIEFFRRQGWRCTNEGWINPENVEESLPDEIDWNAVHTALMGMSDSEWKHFGNKIILKMNELPSIGSSSTLRDMLIQTLKTPLPTLFEYYMKATEGRKI